MRATTTAPFGLNVFVVEPYHPDMAKVGAYRRTLEPEAAFHFDIELGEARWDDDHWRAKVDLVLDLRPDVVSFTFGCPSAGVLRQLAGGVLSMVTVTSVAEARVAVDRGAASLSVQGPNAGGHRGTWDLEAPPNQTPLLDLMSAVLAVVGCRWSPGAVFTTQLGCDR